MFEKSPLSIALAAAAFALTAVACGGAEPEQPSAVAGEHPADPRDTMTADGLTVDEASADHAAGRFVRDDVAVRFDFRRDGARRSASITKDDGAPILKTTLENGFDTSEYFGGQAIAKGPVNGEIAERTGDAAVFEAVGRSPEIGLVPQLKEALLASGRVSEDLFRMPVSRTEGDRLRTQGLGDGQWRIVTPNTSYGFFSWSFWGTTTVIVGDYMDWWGGFYRASFQAGVAGPEYLAGYGHNVYGRNWWGAWVNVMTDRRYLELCAVNDPYCGYRNWIWVYAY